MQQVQLPTYIYKLLLYGDNICVADIPFLGHHRPAISPSRFTFVMYRHVYYTNAMLTAVQVHGLFTLFDEDGLSHTHTSLSVSRY